MRTVYITMILAMGALIGVPLTPDGSLVETGQADHGPCPGFTCEETKVDCADNPFVTGGSSDFACARAYAHAFDPATYEWMRVRGNGAGWSNAGFTGMLATWSAHHDTERCIFIGAYECEEGLSQIDIFNSEFTAWAEACVDWSDVVEWILDFFDIDSIDELEAGDRAKYDELEGSSEDIETTEMGSNSGLEDEVLCARVSATAEGWP